jgi:hypothetical protein
MAGRIPIYRRVGDVLRMRPGKADRGICTSCHRMPSRALPPATAQLSERRKRRRPVHCWGQGFVNRMSRVPAITDSLGLLSCSCRLIIGSQSRMICVPIHLDFLSYIMRAYSAGSAYERSTPTKLLTPCSGQGDTPDAAAGNWRRPKPGHASGRDADPYQSSAQRAALRGPIPPTNSQQTIKRSDRRLAIGPLTCASW